MSYSTRIVNFTFASGATSTAPQLIGDCSRVVMYVSNVTGWNAAAGNTTISLRGSPLSGVTCTAMQAASIATETSQGLYHLSGAIGIPFQCVAFATATSGAGTITVMYGIDD